MILVKVACCDDDLRDKKEKSMKKKLITLGLSLVMVLSLAACGGNSESGSRSEESSSAKAKTEEEADDNVSEEEENTSGTEQGSGAEAVSDDEVSEDLLKFLEQLTLLEPSDSIVGTEWGFSGGMLDGTEMEQEELDETLETVYGGKLNIVFDDEKNISMVQGGGTLKGTYSPTEDIHVMGIVFDNDGEELVYAGLFADVDGTEVLMLFADDSGKNAIYFTQN